MLYQLKQMVKKNRFLSVLFYAIDGKVSTRKNEQRRKLFQKYGVKTAEQVICVLSNTNIRYFATFGTLLGLVRDHKFMDYDDDLDFAVMDDEDFSWEKLDSVLAGVGFRKSKTFLYDNDRVESTYVNAHGVAVDFFMQKRIGDDYYGYYFSRIAETVYPRPEDHTTDRMKMPKLKGISECSVYSLLFPIPANYEEFLQHFYGTGWKVPDPNWVEDGYHYERQERYGQMIKY